MFSSFVRWLFKPRYSKDDRLRGLTYTVLDLLASYEHPCPGDEERQQGIALIRARRNLKTYAEREWKQYEQDEAAPNHTWWITLR